MLEKVRFGVVGCGAIGPWHAAAVSKAEDAELIACCDLIEERAASTAAQFGAKKVYTSYDAMLSDNEIDAICICTPSGLHGDMVVAAAKAGKHVLCEKPIEITVAKMDEMISACEDAGVKMGCIFQRRTSPLWHAIKDTVDSGCLGKIVLGDAYLKYFRSQEYYDNGGWRGTWALDGGGALMNQGVHMVDILRWIMGPVETVYAKTGHLVRDIETEDTACAVITFKNGAFGVLEGTTSVTPGMDHRLEIHGEKGSILVEGERIIRWDVPETDDLGACELDGRGGVDIKKGTAETDPNSDATEGHRVLVQDLCEAIRDDRDPMVTGREARKAVELILAIYESSKTGQPVSM